jgi:hypothetical protein
VSVVKNAEKKEKIPHNFIRGNFKNWVTMMVSVIYASVVLIKLREYCKLKNTP